MSIYTLELNNEQFYVGVCASPYTHISCSVYTEHFKIGKNFVPYVRYILTQYQKLNFCILPFHRIPHSPYSDFLCSGFPVHCIFVNKKVLDFQYIYFNLIALHCSFFLGGTLPYSDF